MPNGERTDFRNGYQYWWLNGQWHRTDGPAYINRTNGYKAWYLNNVCYRWSRRYA